jgi:hypothetical protein
MKLKIKEVEDLRNRSLKKSKIEEIEAFKKSTIQEIKDWRIWGFKKLKIEEFEDFRKSKFGDSTRVYNSNWVSGATDVGMPFGYPWISIPGPTHYGGGLAQGLEDWLGDEEGRF